MTLADLSVEDLAHDHHGVVSRLRAERPVAWAAATDRWLVSRHDLVLAVVEQVDVFVSDHPRSLIRDTFGPQMLSADGAEQRRHRAPYAAAFRPRHVRTTLAASVRTRARELVAALAPGQDVSGPASRLAILTVLDVLGLAQVADPERVSGWYDQLAAALSNVAGDDDVAARGRRAVDAFGRALQQAADEGLLVAPPDDALSDEERVSNTLLVLFGGIETTQSAILNALWALATHPRAQGSLQADRTLLPGAVEEALRWEPSVLTLTRFTAREVELAGVRIPRDSVVECLIAGANRDPSVFPDPDRFDIRRANAGEHLTFGHGQHFCLGAHLARLEAVALLEAFLDRAPGGFGLAHAEAPGPRGHEFRRPPELCLIW